MLRKLFSRSTVVALLWFSLGFGAWVATSYAAKYAAISFHYYYGQHQLLEPYTESDGSATTPYNEGRLVYVKAKLRAATPAEDPLYDIHTADGLRLSREIIQKPLIDAEGSAHYAPAPPPEAHLRPWESPAPALRLGAYELAGHAAEWLHGFKVQHPIKSIVAISRELRSEATVSGGDLLFTSSNGFPYQVRFSVELPRQISLMGRQRGNTLEYSDAEQKYHYFIEHHSPTSLLKALLNAAFFLLAAWLGSQLVVHAAVSAFGRRLSMALTMRAAFVLAVLLTLVCLYQVCDAGAITVNPIFEHPWAPLRRRFISGLLDPHRVLLAQRLILLAGVVCVLAALLPIPAALKRLRAAKKA